MKKDNVFVDCPRSSVPLQASEVIQLLDVLQ